MSPPLVGFRMPKLPRKQCPKCGRSVPVRVGGELREHDPRGACRRRRDGKCPGSGLSVGTPRTSRVRDITADLIKTIEDSGVLDDDPGVDAVPRRSASRVTNGTAAGVDVEALRRELMVSQVELAKLLQVSKRTVIRWEAGAPQTGPAALLLRVLRDAVTAAPKDWRLPVLRVDGRAVTSRWWVDRAASRPVEVWSQLFALADDGAR